MRLEATNVGLLEERLPPAVALRLAVCRRFLGRNVGHEAVPRVFVHGGRGWELEGEQ